MILFDIRIWSGTMGKNIQYSYLVWLLETNIFDNYNRLAV